MMRWGFHPNSGCPTRKAGRLRSSRAAGRSSSTWDELVPIPVSHEPGAVGMKRRSFVSLVGTGAALLGGEATRAGGVTPGPEGRRRSGTPVKMHVGTQQGPTTPRMLQYFKRHGVNHICGYP